MTLENEISELTEQLVKTVTKMITGKDKYNKLDRKDAINYIYDSLNNIN